MATNTWEYGWQWRAACRGEDSSLFFAPAHPEGKEERELDVEELFDFVSLKVVVKEVATGRILVTRDMTESEKIQTRLPFEGRAAGMTQ